MINLKTKSAGWKEVLLMIIAILFTALFIIAIALYKYIAVNRDIEYGG